MVILEYNYVFCTCKRGGHLLEHGRLLDISRYLICIIMNINENLKIEVKC